MNSKENAFTLVELILAATLTAVILGGAFLSLSVMLRAYKEIGGMAEQAEAGRLILERMRADISAAYLSPHSDLTRFVGFNLQQGNFHADSLTFISRVNNPIETGGGSSDLAEVQFYVDLDDSTPEQWLLRRFDPTPDNDPFTGGQVALLGPNVISLNFEYFDGQAWWPSWDSESEIPMAVYVSFGIFVPRFPNEQPAAETLKTYSTTIWLSAYRTPSDSTAAEEGGSSTREPS